MNWYCELLSEEGRGGGIALGLRDAFGEPLSVRVLLGRGGHSPVERRLLLALAGREEGGVILLKGAILDLLRDFNLTSRLYRCGERLWCDLKTIPMRWVIERDGRESYLYEIFCRRGEREIALRECVLVGRGPPCWGLWRGFLLLFPEGVNGLLLSAAYKGLPLLLEGDLLNRLMEMGRRGGELLEVGGAPQLPLEEENPLPELHFSDGRGCFARLDYLYGSRRYPYRRSDRSLQGRSQEEEREWERELIGSGYSYRPDPQTPYFCSPEGVGRAMEILLRRGWPLFDSHGRQLRLCQRIDLELDCLEGEQTIRGSVHYEGGSLPIGDFRGPVSRGEPLLPLNEKEAGVIPQELFDDELFPLMLESGGKSCLAALAAARGREGILLGAEARGFVEELRGETLPDIMPSDRFKGELRPYQLHGVRWLYALYRRGLNPLLADEMGLGKTVQLLALLSLLPRGAPTLIIAPTSLLPNWRREIARFLPNEPLQIHEGPERAQKGERMAREGIILTSYALLRRDRELLLSLDYRAAILDEAQAIKNGDTQNAQIAYQLRAPLRIAVSGTPIENRLSEIWSHFHFLMPTLLPAQREFFTTLAQGEGKGGARALKQRIAPFILRRKKCDVAPDLPEKVEQISWIEMDEEESASYRALLKKMRSQLFEKISSTGISRQRMQILETILRLRQFCCHPRLIPNLCDEPPKASKFHSLMSDLEEIASSHKVLVYSQFTSMLQLMGEELQRKALPFILLEGSTRGREELVDRFQHDSSLPIFLISLKAGGVGLNLTAADYVFIYEPWWNRAVENQAIDRAHRIGRKECVFAKRYLYQESIEERIEALKERKGALAESILEEGVEESFSDEELLELLGD